MSSINIWIVDDEELDRYLLMRDLKQTGVQANIAEFGSSIEALNSLRDSRDGGEETEPSLAPQIIFLDINLPRISGLAFLEEFEELRNQHPALKRCSILMMSSVEHPDERQRTLRHDFVAGFVTKGKTDAAELNEMIESALTP